jgi:hypothetical protein
VKHEKVTIGARVTRVSGPQRLRTLIVLLAGTALTATLLPQAARTADSKLLVVDVVAVAEGYRASKLTGTKVMGPDNKSIGELDDLVIGKTDRVMFAIIQWAAFSVWAASSWRCPTHRCRSATMADASCYRVPARMRCRTCRNSSTAVERAESHEIRC